MTSLKLRDMILISIFSALTAIGAFIKFDIGTVPFTMQFAFCAYAGLILGAKKGFISQIIYVLIGLIGIPIFARGGGITYIFQPTFGYLIGFIVCAYVIGKLTENIDDYYKKSSILKIFLSVLTGLFFVYLFGVSYLYMIFNTYLDKSISISKAIAFGFTPYIVSDFTLSVLVTFSSSKVLSALKSKGMIRTSYES